MTHGSVATTRYIKEATEEQGHNYFREIPFIIMTYTFNGKKKNVY